MAGTQLTDGITYRILPRQSGEPEGRCCVAFLVGSLALVVNDDSGIPIEFATAASALRWIAC